MQGYQRLHHDLIPVLTSEGAAGRCRLLSTEDLYPVRSHFLVLHILDLDMFNFLP